MPGQLVGWVWNGIFALVAVGICVFTFWDSHKIFTASTKGLDVGSVYKLRYVRVFRGNILEPYLLLGVRLRLWVWPVLTTFFLALLCLLKFSSLAIVEILPHALAGRVMPALEDQPALQKAALMLLAYFFLIIVPGQIGDPQPDDKSREVSLKKKIFNVYSRLHRRFIEDFVLRGQASGSGGSGEHVSTLALDIETQIKSCLRDSERVSRFLKSLAKGLGLRSPTPHQTIITYLNAYGAKTLLELLYNEGCREFRIYHRAELILRRVDGKRALREVDHVCVSRTFFCRDLSEVLSIRLERSSELPPEGQYRVVRLAGRRLKRGVVVSLVAEEDRFRLECGPSSRLGKALARELLRS